MVIAAQLNISCKEQIEFNMKAVDYRIAYKFLQIRATEPGPATPFRVTQNLPQEQQERIYKFLRQRHGVRMI
jgi:ABC-type phosphate/phosphonate transport system substrate-binding protein